MSETTTWVVGQRAAIGRRQIVTIDNVTPTGRAYVGDRVFWPNGRERGYYTNPAIRLEPLTAEIEDEISRAENGKRLSARIHAQARRLDQLGDILWTAWAKTAASAADIEKAERLLAAIQGVLDNA